MRFKSFIFVHLFSMTDSCLLICVHECLQYPHYPHMIIVTINRFISFFLFLSIAGFFYVRPTIHLVQILCWILRCDFVSRPNSSSSQIEKYCRWSSFEFSPQWNPFESNCGQFWLFSLNKKNSNFTRSYFLIFQLTFQRALEYIRHHVKWFIQPNICCPKVESVIRKRNKKMNTNNENEPQFPSYAIQEHGMSFHLFRICSHLIVTKEPICDINIETQLTRQSESERQR